MLDCCRNPEVVKLPVKLPSIAPTQAPMSDSGLEANTIYNRTAPSYWAENQSGSKPSEVSLHDREQALRRWGNFSLAYSTAYQPRLEYFGDANGYLAYARRMGLTFVLGDPVCSSANRKGLLSAFLDRNQRVSFVHINESTARDLSDLKFFVNEMGVDTLLDLKAFSFAGKDREWLRYADNWVSRRGYQIVEGTVGAFEQQIVSVSEAWRTSRTVKRKEVRFINRPIPMRDENDVRRFFLLSPEGHLEAFVYFDPLYCEGQIQGYVTCIKRRLPTSSNYVEPAIMKQVIEVFQREGVTSLWLGLSPGANIENRLFPCSRGLHWVSRYCHQAAWFNRYIYNFKGHTQYKSRFRGSEHKVYYASRARFNVFRLMTLASLCGVF